MPDQVSFAKGSTKPTSGITTGRLYVVDSSTTDKSDLYLGKDATHLIQIGATVEQGAKADSSVQSVKVGSTSYSPSSGVVSLPAYPTVYNATLTIKNNSVSIGTFTSNASSNVDINIATPQVKRYI